ncbi:ELO2 Elongation of fatty acids protein 2 [Candida maltosa Xu316]
MSLPIPSWEKPFGIELWPIFDSAVTFISNGKFIPSEFDFTPGVTPLATFSEAAVIIVIYYTVIFGGRAVIRGLNLPVIKLNSLFQIHNLFLTTLSLTLLVLIVEQIIPFFANGLHYSVCAPEVYTKKLVVLYYLNYITKFIELIDTVFLVVRQKKLTFLHTYHHGATALLCYTQLVGYTSVQWVPITLNLGVHVVMYWYYFLAARGIRVWWKEWVTRFQIIQFVIDLYVVYYCTVTHFGYKYFNVLRDCSGTEQAAVVGCSILSSYLVLFIAFYFNTYKKSGSKKVKKA